MEKKKEGGGVARERMNEIDNGDETHAGCLSYLRIVWRHNGNVLRSHASGDESAHVLPYEGRLHLVTLALGVEAARLLVGVVLITFLGEVPALGIDEEQKLARVNNNHNHKRQVPQQPGPDSLVGDQLAPI